MYKYIVMALVVLNTDIATSNSFSKSLLKWDTQYQEREIVYVIKN